MRILAAVQSVFALAFIVFGALALLGIGITGLPFLFVGAIFAGLASLTEDNSRAAAALSLAADAVIAYMAARKLAALSLENPRLFDYVPPSAALVLVAIGVLAVVLDRRALRNTPWF